MKNSGRWTKVSTALSLSRPWGSSIGLRKPIIALAKAGDTMPTPWHTSSWLP